MGLLEVVGIGSILPFMKIVATEDVSTQTGWTARLMDFTGLHDHRSLVLASGAAVFLLIALSNLVKIYVGWRQQKVIWDVSHNLSSRLLALYLGRGYGYFLGKNTVELKVKILQEINTFTTGVLVPIQGLLAQVTLMLVIFLLLVLVNPWLAISTLLFLGGIFGCIYLVRRRELGNLGEIRIHANVRRYRSLIELFSGIKAFLVHQEEAYFHQRFSQAAEEYSEIQPRLFLITFVPRMVVEIIAFGGLIILTVYLVVSEKSLLAALPVLTLYALAGIKLLPAVQGIYASFSKLRHNSNIVDALYEDITHDLNGKTIFPPPAHSPIAFNHSISFQNLTFQYETAASETLREVNLEIKHGETVAFIGSTGSGKSTMVDLIVGLLRPQTGAVKIDDVELTAETTPGWHQLLAYVPQDVVLFDASIASNIAIGDENIDYELLERVAKIAKIYDFINEELTEGFETTVGERGARVSGGQKQRIGLARALYRQPRVLILDEATSALDNLTESEVLQSLTDNTQDLTLIVVAHRLATVRDADVIHILKNGKIIASGSYDKLLNNNTEFRQLAQLN
jgi:ATP-binding cassette subfamily C protein